MNSSMSTWSPATARWIWLAGDETPANAYARVRKGFTLMSVPKTATVHASADCRYLLFVNGAVVGRGPVTTDPKYKQVNVYDVARHLRRGTNVVAAFVLQRNHHTTRLYPTRGGFLLQLDAGNVSLGTDASWKAQWADDYRRDAPMMTHQYGHQEWVDGRKTPVGWETTGFDDQSWSNAIPVPDPERFWPRALELRRVPHMEREIVHPQNLVAYFGLSTNGRPREQDSDPATQIMRGYPLCNIVAWDPEHILRPEKGPAIFREKDGDGVGLVVDLGTECYGYPFIDIECAANTVVDIGHGEALSRNRIQTVLMHGSTAEQRYGDRYITREGRQRFELFDTKGCRYLEIHFNRLADFYTGAKVIVHEVGIVNSRSPEICHASTFESSDERLNRIWAICRHTAEVKCQDWHICDAQREQNNWPEFCQDMLYWQSFGKLEMLRQMIHQFCRAQLPSGFIPSTFPQFNANNRPLTENDLYVFTTVGFPVLVYLDWLYGGQDDERQLYWLECCGKAFDGLARYVGPNGTIANLPGTQWVEWTGFDARDPGRGVKDSWELPFFNALHVLLLEKLSEMADALDRPAWAADWRMRAGRLRPAADARFWSDARGAYPDGIYDGTMSPFVSQTTNAFAALARLGSRPRLRQAMQSTRNPKRCQVPSGIALMAFYHEALQSLGMDDQVLDRIRKKWGYMLDHGATTTWEAEEALERNMGLCFGFAGHPLNYLARTALGVTPLAPGYQCFSVRVVPHDLTWARGRIVTPRGDISVAWTLDRRSLRLELTVPKGTQAVVALPRGPRRFNRARADGHPAVLAPRGIAICTFLRESLPAFTLGPGRHKIVFAEGHG